MIHQFRVTISILMEFINSTTPSNIVQNLKVHLNAKKYNYVVYYNITWRYAV